MAVPIPASHRDLLEGKTLANLTCHLKNGSILVNPIWCLAEGDTIVVNSAVSRAKDRALRADPHVTLTLLDPANPFRYLEVRGRVTEITEQGAEAMIDQLAKKYLGVDSYPNRRAGEVRVTYRITPEKVRTQG